MTILMVLDGPFPPDSRVRKQVSTLTEAGHDVRILCTGTDQETAEVDGAEVQRYPQVSPEWSFEGVRREFTVQLRNVYPEWMERIRTELPDGIDAVHVHDLPLAKTARQTCDLPIVLDLHENYQHAVNQYRTSDDLSEVLTSPSLIADRVCRPPIRLAREQRIAMQEAAHVLAVVPEAKDDYVDSGIDPEKITVVSNTVDLDWFDEQGGPEPETSDDELVITYVGTLSGHHRGLDTVIRALPALNSTERSVLFRIAGGGRAEERTGLVELADDLGVEDQLEFTGWIDETDFPRYMRAADVGLVPHRSNGHTNTTVPHKLFQYMAAELPVVVTETAAVARIVRGTDSGLVVPPEDPAAMSNAIRDLMVAEVAVEHGANGREAVENEYNWEQDGRTLLRVYEELH